MPGIPGTVIRAEEENVAFHATKSDFVFIIL